jgi:hypothetical protein
LDSLWKLAQKEKEADKKFDLIYKIGVEVTNGNLDTLLKYSRNVLEFGEKYNDLGCKFAGNIFHSYMYVRIGDYAKGQEYTVKASKLAEGMSNNANYMAAVYGTKAFQERNSILQSSYMQKAIALCTNQYQKFSLLVNAAQGFLQMNQSDSALAYAQRANELILKNNTFDNRQLNYVFGEIYLKLNQPDLAYVYFKKNLYLLQLLPPFNYTAIHGSVYWGLIDYFKFQNKIDSMLVYHKKFFSFETPNVYPQKIKASEWIFMYYMQQNNKDSAFKYLLFNKLGMDSLNSSKKVTDLQQAKIKEELRQVDLEKEKLEAVESRNRNIQLAITAIAILSAIILFLLLSRSILVSHKVVEFLSVLVLLVVFEFINLLIHPFLESITHHSPVLMLLGLVAIASLIIPLHHRLEHWTTKILVEKNKAIRLANAKKTIEELGEKEINT